MVVNNIGRAETGIVAGNFMGVLHSVVTNHKFNQIFLRRMNNTTNFRPENSPHRTNFRSKFRVAFTPSRNLSPKVRAVQNNTCLENSQKCRRSFVSVKNSSKSQEFRRISSTGVCITFAQYCIITVCYLLFKKCLNITIWTQQCNVCLLSLGGKCSLDTQ